MSIKSYFLFLWSKIEMTIEMTAQIAIMRVKIPSYVTMCITSCKGGKTVRR